MALRTRIIDRDKGMKRFFQQVKEARGAFVKVGVTESVGSEPKEVRGEKTSTGRALTLVLVAWFNEFGTKRIPARSFIRSTTDEQRRNIFALKRKLMMAIIGARMSVRAGLTTLGEWMQEKIQDKITRVRTPANAPSTIARKGSSNPLIDLGQLRQSIRYEVTVPNEGG